MNEEILAQELLAMSAEANSTTPTCTPDSPVLAVLWSWKTLKKVVGSWINVCPQIIQVCPDNVKSVTQKSHCLFSLSIGTVFQNSSVVD